MNSERNILESATNRLSQATNLHCIIRSATKGKFDAQLIVKDGAKEYPYTVEVKRYVNEGVLGALRLQFDSTPPGHPLLVVATYIQPGVAKTMRTLGIQYLDEAGNAYLKRDGLLILVQGERPIKTAQQTDAFGWAGSKVLFAFFSTPTLLDAPYRAIAKASGVGLGTVSGVVEELKKRKYLLSIGGKAHLRNREELFQEWVRGYVQNLRPKLLLGQFDSDSELNYERIPEYGFAGGETAAHMLQKYLHPGIQTVYVSDSPNTLILELRLKRREYGRIELRQMFWDFEYPEKAMGVAPVHLVYADLIAQADPRTIEAATMIYDEYIVRHLR